MVVPLSVAQVLYKKVYLSLELNQTYLYVLVTALVLRTESLASAMVLVVVLAPVA